MATTKTKKAVVSKNETEIEVEKKEEKNIKIRMLKNLYTIYGLYILGKEYEVPQRRAKSMIANGDAFKC